MNVKYSGFALLLAVGAGMLFATELRAQVPTVKGKGKMQSEVYLKATAVPEFQSQVAFTVPAGKRLVITDLIFRNGNQFDFRVAQDLRVGPAGDVLIRAAIPPGNTFEHTFATGLVFEPGEQVIFFNNDDDGPSDFVATGYLTKAPAP